MSELYSIASMANLLTRGAQLALMGMSEEWQKSSSRTFHQNGAAFLYKNYSNMRGFVPLCERGVIPEHGRMRAIWRLTPTGAQVKQELLNRNR